jgi:hypothetical protein
MAQEWNIRGRAGACSACQAAFTDGQTYFTRLIFQEHDYSRGDYCEPCWAAEAAPQPRYSSWKGVFRSPPADPDRRLKKETAEHLLRDLIEEANPARRNAIYILAVMLERQRVFVERELKTRADGERIVIYEHKKTAETFAIVDPQLKLSELDAVQQDIMTLLTGGEPEKTESGEQKAESEEAP